MCGTFTRDIHLLCTGIQTTQPAELWSWQNGSPHPELSVYSALSHGAPAASIQHGAGMGTRSSSICIGASGIGVRPSETPHPYSYSCWPWNIVCRRPMAQKWASSVFSLFKPPTKVFLLRSFGPFIHPALPPLGRKHIAECVFLAPASVCPDLQAQTESCNGRGFGSGMGPGVMRPSNF